METLVITDISLAVIGVTIVFFLPKIRTIVREVLTHPASKTEIKTDNEGHITVSG